ncbi:MAG TPA: anti-sigma factor, partial [Candidatus Acidoferrales bacterium]|nr:anti-sigma factor [Candidatus Acidoferrales bacterium]
MSDRDHTQAMLDDVATYALGALPAADAERVRRHIAGCSECAGEYAALKPVVAALGSSAGADASPRPGALLKARVMQAAGAPNRGRAPERPRAPVWPAYLVAAACFAIAIITSVWNVALIGQLKQSQTELTRVSERSNALARNLADERATISDLLDSNAKHYAAGDDEVVARGSRLYVAMRALPEPPRGKVYQAWTLA